MSTEEQRNWNARRGRDNIRNCARFVYSGSGSVTLSVSSGRSAVCVTFREIIVDQFQRTPRTTCESTGEESIDMRTLMEEWVE
ncbi:hypothetical protein J6590_020129 [Homalodisca vitripennis]|nr:hypothetical protein J6590_020129 [Homalodisca vitripennis]